MKVYIKTIGCKTNYADSTRIAEGLVKKGLTLSGTPQEADVLIVNSCVVTHRAESDVRKALRRLRRINPGARVVLTGCGASLDDGKPFSGLADLVKPPDPDDIARGLGIDVCRGEGVLGDLPVEGGRVRRYVKVQDGCNLACTYCIVPRVRGKSRSRKPDEVVGEVGRLEKAGVREVVLTGVHLGHYGVDLDGKRTLSKLLRRLLDSTKKIRFRLSSLEVDEIDDELLSMIAEEERVCRHLHVPLQSGDDGILRAMGRWYDTRQFSDAIWRIKSSVPEVCVGTDVITGFPGEELEQFERTEVFLKEIPVDYIHVFSYSRRRGTRAAEMENQIPEHEKKRRTEVLRALSEEKRKMFLMKFMGAEGEIVCEKVDRGKCQGMTDNYIRVEAAGTADVGELVRVRIEEVIGARVRGVCV